jgi:hypothetical protein
VQSYLALIKPGATAIARKKTKKSMNNGIESEKRLLVIGGGAGPVFHAQSPKEPLENAQMYLYLRRNGYATGQVTFVEGGSTLTR